MTIENREEYINNLWDWACLDGCFGQTKIRPTDIDGFVERNGHFLAIETKAPTATIPKGQHITLDRLARLKEFTVLVVWGAPGLPERIQQWGFPPRPADLAEFRRTVAAWYHYADSQGFN